jgi:uncharacterized membrane protein
MDDRRLETMIGQLLWFGVLLAAVIVFAGGVLYLVRHHADRADFRTFVVGGQNTRTLSGIVESAASLNCQGIIQFGLLLLIATPLARVAMALVGFALEKDRLYTVVSLIVLLILTVSLFHAT